MLQQNSICRLKILKILPSYYMMKMLPLKEGLSLKCCVYITSEKAYNM